MARFCAIAGCLRMIRASAPFVGRVLARRAGVGFGGGACPDPVWKGFEAAKPPCFLVSGSFRSAEVFNSGRVPTIGIDYRNLPYDGELIDHDDEFLFLPFLLGHESASGACSEAEEVHLTAGPREFDSWP